MDPPTTYGTILAAIEERAATAAGSCEHGDERQLCLELRNVVKLHRAGECIERLLTDGDIAVPTMLQQIARLPPPCPMWGPVVLGYRVTRKSWPLVTTVADLFAPIDPAVRHQAVWPFHQGLGLAIAEALFQPLSETSSDTSVDAAVAQFTSLCRKNALPPHVSTALDALGFIVAGKPAKLAKRVDELVASSYPDAAPHYWHGTGRAQYFEFAPQLDVTRAGAYLQSLVQGYAWQATITNVDDPCIVAAYAHALSAESDECIEAFVSGVISALAIWAHSVPSDDARSRFGVYEPTALEQPLWCRVAQQTGARQAHSAPHLGVARTSRDATSVSV